MPEKLLLNPLVNYRQPLAAADTQREQHSNFAVEIAPLTCFYPAEDYYQDYLEKNPGGYCPIDSDVFDRILSEVNG